jgi:hypothetical protein
MSGATVYTDGTPITCEHIDFTPDITNDDLSFLLSPISHMSGIWTSPEENFCLDHHALDAYRDAAPKPVYMLQVTLRWRTIVACQPPLAFPLPIQCRAATTKDQRWDNPRTNILDQLTGSNTL